MATEQRRRNERISGLFLLRQRRTPRSGARNDYRCILAIEEQYPLLKNVIAIEC